MGEWQTDISIGLLPIIRFFWVKLLRFPQELNVDGAMSPPSISFKLQRKLVSD